MLCRRTPCWLESSVDEFLVSVTPFLNWAGRLIRSLSSSNNQLSRSLSLFPALHLLLCLSLRLSIQPVLLQLLLWFPLVPCSAGLQWVTFSPVALGDWDWQPSCLLVSSAGWFKKCYTLHIRTHAHTHGHYLQRLHIAKAFVFYSVTIARP